MRIFLHQLRSEQLVFWRSREAAIFVFVFPILLFVLLNAVYSGESDGHAVVDVLVAGLLGYGVANTALGGFAIILVGRRETGILKRVARGQANKEIARDLFVEERTVKTHVTSILRKLGVKSRTQAALHAVRSGLVTVDELSEEPW